MASALSSWTSRSPPRPHLRSGSARWAISTAALPARLGVLDEFVEARRDSGAPLPPRPADQQRRQVGVAGDVPRLEHRQPGRDVLAGDLERLRHGPHAVVEPNVGVPQRVPQQLGDLADDLGGHVVVQQHQIEIGVRQHLAAAEPTGGDDREATVGVIPISAAFVVSQNSYRSRVRSRRASRPRGTAHARRRRCRRRP